MVSLLCACLGPAVGPGLQRARELMAQNRVDEAIEVLEKLCARYPESYEARIGAGIAWYTRARASLDRKDESDYLNALHLSQDHILEAVRLRPGAAEPHLWMGVILAYRDDLDGSVASFRNARRLEPRQPVHTLNLAQMLMFQGDLRSAERLILRADGPGPNESFAELLKVVLDWRRGKVSRARARFAALWAYDAEAVQTWDIAPVDRPIDSFDDFADYCCGLSSCGPHLGDACARLGKQVVQRDVSAETVRQELVQEMERRRRLREIYDKDQDRGLEIEVLPSRDPNEPGPTGP